MWNQINREVLHEFKKVSQDLLRRDGERRLELPRPKLVLFDDLDWERVLARYQLIECAVGLRSVTLI